MTGFKTALAAAAALLALAAVPATADTYIRKGDQAIDVAVKGGKLYCTRSSDGFEMCNGMTKSGSAWTGGGMKHPDMPGFMSFNGTVVVFGDELRIKGCALHEAFCDSETWTRAQ